MGHGHHHHGHHHQGQQEQSYGGYSGSSSSGNYEMPYAPQVPEARAYGYGQQVGNGGYGYEQPAPYAGAIQSYAGYGAGQPSYGGAMQSYQQNNGYGGAMQPYPQNNGYGGAMQAYQQNGGAMQSYQQNGGMESVNHLLAQEHKHKTNEHRAEAVALGASAFALYEHHEAKVDPLHAARHHREEQIAGALAVGAGGYAVYEHQQARHDHQQLQAAGYYPESGRKHEKKHHHGLFRH